MPAIDIKEDRRLRVAWFKYQHILTDMNGRYNKQKFIQNQMDTNNLSQWEAMLVFEGEIKKIEQQRRTEMYEIRKQVIAEHKEKKQQEKIRDEEEKQRKLAELEKKRVTRQLRKEQLLESPPPLRRSNRIASRSQSP